MSNYKCKICGQLAEHEWCGAKWAIEFNCDTKILTVWHEGKHNCILKCQSISKEEKEAKKDLLKTVLCIFPRLPKTKLIDVGAQYYHKWNNCDTYVFKISQTAAEIGLALDRTARQTPLRELILHMDRLHSHVKGFIMLTLWVKNPTSLITHCLACMKRKSEDTQNVTLFLCLYNEILCKVKGDSSYVWSPRGIMTDKNRANKNAVRAILGEEMACRTWSCTWHYL